MQISRYAGAMTSALALAMAFPIAGFGEELPLWKIQKTLAAKKYVDLTHSFEPGIPRWPGFPDETRKTIYWYDKHPDTMGSGFFSEVLVMLASGARTSIRQPISSRASALLIKLIPEK